MDQELALEIMLAGENVMLTGPAGSGKTYVLNQFVKNARKSGKKVAVTATTGLAATHLGGNTIHAWSGIGVNDSLPKYFYSDMTKSRQEQIQTTDVLVIDEISMLHDFRLDLIDQITRQVREVEEPFGGLQVIMCGDFFQLPPINRAESKDGSFVVNSAVWQEMQPVICYLNVQYRQDDQQYLDILSAIRNNDLRRKHAENLLERKEFYLDNVTELHTTNVDVDAINQRKLDELDGDEYIYEMETTGSKNYVESLKKSCLANETLRLKKGALVMFIKNSPDKKYVNGSLGEVVDFEPLTEYPIVQLKNGKKVTASPDSWETRDGNKKRAGLTQVPLRLAWAITVHKSQGMTLDGARIDLSRAFTYGMGYVALSRVKNLDSLSLVGINKMAFLVSPEALEIDEVLQSKSLADSEKFSHLRKNAKKRKSKKQPEKTKSDWNTKVSKMRETYPNAFRPWKSEDDEKLVKMFSEKPTIDIKKLTETFGRHPGSIRARLKKHFGEDAVS